MREMAKFEDQVENIDLITSSLEGRLKCSLQENETLHEQIGQLKKYEELYFEVSQNLPEINSSHNYQLQRIQELEADFSRERESYQALTILHQGCQPKIQTLTDQLQISQSALKELSSKTSHLEKEMSLGLQEQAIELERHMRDRDLEKNQESEEFKGQMLAKTNEIETLKAEKEQLQFELNTLQSSLKEIQAEHSGDKIHSYESLSSQFSSISSLYSSLQTSHTSLQAENSSLQKENSRLSSENEELQLCKGKLEGAEIVKEDWKRKIESLLLENDKLTSILNQKEQESSSLQNELEKMANIIEEREKEYSNYSKKANELLSVNEVMNNELMKLKEDNTKMSEAMEKRVGAFSQEKSELLSLLEETRDFIREKDAELLSLKEQNIHERDSYVKKLLESVHDLKEANSMKNLEIEEKEEKLAKMKSHLKFINQKFQDVYIEATKDEGLISHLESYLSMIPEMREVLLKYQRSSDDYRAKIFEKIEKISSEKVKLFHEIESEQQAKHALQLKLEECEQNLASKTFQSNSMIKQYKSLKALNNSFKEEGSQLFEAIKGKKEENEQLLAENENLVEKNKNLATEHLDLEEAHKAAICKLEHQDLRVSQLQKECEELAHVSTEFSHELSARREEVTKVLGDFEDLQKTLKSHIGAFI